MANPVSPEDFGWPPDPELMLCVDRNFTNAIDDLRRELPGQAMHAAIDSGERFIIAVGNRKGLTISTVTSPDEVVAAYFCFLHAYAGCIDAGSVTHVQAVEEDLREAIRAEIATEILVAWTAQGNLQ